MGTGMTRATEDTDIQDDKDGNSRYARGKVQAYWVGNIQRCPNQRNDTNQTNGSVSFSREGAANKEVAYPAYRTRYYDSGNGVLNDVSYTVC